MYRMTRAVPGFRMPAEWVPHRATWLAWPHRTSDWPGKFTPIRWVYAEIVRTLARYEWVELLVRDAAMRTEVVAVLSSAHADLTNVRFHTIKTDRSWLRDSGPIFVTDGAGTKRGLDWHFNGWAKYPDWKVDDAVPKAILAKLGLPAVCPTVDGRRVVLEGGGIDVNGEGLLLTTEEWLLSAVQVRNPGFSRADYEQVFAEYLGVSRTLWLNKGIVGDDTHGHVDDLARFVGPRTVVAVREDDPADPNYGLLRENLDRLRGFGLDVVVLPMPRPVVFRGQRLPASYANFYVANGVVLVPTFNDPADRVALNTLADLFPGRDVVGIHAVDLVLGLGTLHCLSQQEPA
jgi:agmatine deiminase